MFRVPPFFFKRRVSSFRAYCTGIHGGFGFRRRFVARLCTFVEALVGLEPWCLAEFIPRVAADLNYWLPTSLNPKP